MTPGRLETIERGETLSQRAYQAIRRAIRDGGLVQDRVYSEGELGMSMGISRTPVREALIEFARQGIIEILPQRGFRLRAFNEAEREEVFDLRCVLESLVFERLAKEGGEDDVQELRKILKRQRAVADDPVAFLELDEQFHLLGAQVLGLDRTHEMIRTLRGAMWLLGAQALANERRVPEVLTEHERIVEAVAARDVRKVRAAMKAHLNNTASAVDHA
jgi:DNA-binding GntR family transcriptional regulator